MISIFTSRMLSPSFHIKCILLFSFFSITTCSMIGNETDRLSLLEFKSRITADPFGVLDSWNDTVHFCEWHGITCGRRHRRATILNLQSSKLSGSVSPHLGNLSFLRELNLLANELNGDIPPQIGYPKKLETLNLGNNSLSGIIPPSLSNCSGLTTLNLGFNDLIGEIPVELTSLTKLQFLRVRRNHLTGRILPSIGNLSNLEILGLGENSLHGSIPDSLSQFSKIRIMDLALNNLSGTIPPAIFNLSTVTVLFVMLNKLQGSLPSDLFMTLPNIKHIGFAVNSFWGSIPSSLSNSSNLVTFQVQENHFSGTMPSLANSQRLQWLANFGNRLGTGKTGDLDFLSSLVNATGLSFVEIADNNFGGKLPKTIGNLSTSLTHLLLHNNKIFGSIPPGIAHLDGPTELIMQSNRISGTIPPSIGMLPNLVRLNLSDNQLNGNIPPSFGNLTQLNILVLSRNFLHGKIPPSLGRMQGLALLDLSRNNLTSSIPVEIFGLSQLSIYMDLSKNQLIGPLPVEVGNLKNLGVLEVSGNMLSGEIPFSLGACESLEGLYMAGNKFQGTIPSALSSLKGLQVLDISRNNLSGEIPVFLERLKLLRFLNLSYNNFEGPLPVNGVFWNGSEVFIDGNNKLCGGSVELHLPKCVSKEEPRKRKLSSTVKIVIFVISSLLGASMLALLLFLTLFKQKRRVPPTSRPFHESYSSVSYHSLHKATDGFSEANLIGRGAFGSVYKGIISEGKDRKFIAVKVLNMLVPGAIRSFMAECEALRNIRHRNLVKLITVCSGIDGGGNDFRALVYEFIPNGSLNDWLHRTCLGEDEGADGTRKSLSILERLNIAIDTAWALDYLHHQSETPIIHRDLKPSNILLDAEMVARVGDFGLAKLIHGPVGQENGNQSSTSAVKGSIGYVAPEYAMGSEASALGDVYSFGIVLLEMFTGKRPTDEMFIEALNLHNFAKESLPGRVEEITDLMLLEEIVQSIEEERRRYNQTRASARRDKIIDCLVLIYQIGVACSSEQPNERMNIAEVVAQLNSTRKKLMEVANIISDHKRRPFLEKAYTNSNLARIAWSVAVTHGLKDC